MKKCLLFMVIMNVLWSCASSDWTQPMAGDWLLDFKTQETHIPINASIKDSLFYIHNGNETITFSLRQKKDSFHIPIPDYASHIEGMFSSDTTFDALFVKDDVEDYKIMLTGHFLNTSVDESLINANQVFPKYKVQIQRRKTVTDAIGLFSQVGPSLTGSFATETGDYRYLSGEVLQNTLKLTSFDGSHLYLFTAEIKNDSLVNGKFISGKTGNYTWSGQANSMFELAKPELLTKVRPGNEPDFSSYFLTSANDSISLMDKAFDGKVMIIQIMGTWCPNCLDEVRYLNTLQKEYNDEDLSIVAFAFERGTDLPRVLKRLDNYKTRNKINYTLLYGGDLNPETVLTVFPFLSDLKSFPTTIYLDRDKNIRKIYTGFYGPGTGEYYTRFINENAQFISDLLSE